MLVLNYNYGCISNPSGNTVDIPGNILDSGDYSVDFVDSHLAQNQTDNRQC